MLVRALRMWLCFVTLCLALAASSARACSIPVFRYALTRWDPDAYEAIVFHRGPLDGDAKAAADWLQKCSANEEVWCNVAVRLVDLATDGQDGLRKLWEAHGSPELPWMLLRYPMRSGIEADAWAGPLSLKGAQALVDSPVRKTLVQRLTEGQAAVWVLVESGDPKKDEAAAKVLTKNMKQMEKEIQLPQPFAPYGAEEDEPQAAVKVAFSLVRVSRTDAAERVLVQMLLGTEEDLKTFKEPIAFPAFGRGRVLCALVGAGINEENIWDIGAFLCGPCACQIKWQNPGTDLLMSAAWEAALAPPEPVQIEVPPLIDLRELVPDGGAKEQREDEVPPEKGRDAPAPD
jgi:hypothetical protein